MCHYRGMTAKDNTGYRTRQVRQSSIGWMLKRLSGRLDAAMSAELKPLDLNINQFAVMMTLLETEGLTQTEIGRQIAQPGYATTRTMDALESKSMVERRADQHSRRSHNIYLTQRGRAAAPQLYNIVRRVNKQLLSPLEPEQQQQLSHLLSLLLAGDE